MSRLDSHLLGSCAHLFIYTVGARALLNFSKNSLLSVIFRALLMHSQEFFRIPYLPTHLSRSPASYSLNSEVIALTCIHTKESMHFSGALFFIKVYF